MNTEKKSFLRQYNPYHFKFGSKLFLVFFSLLLLCLVTTTSIGFRYLKKYVKESNYTRLEQISQTKKIYIEDKFAVFQKEFASFVEAELPGKASALKNAYNGFSVSGFEDSLNSFLISLKEYYQDELISKISFNTPQIEEILPISDKQILLQYDFIYKNPNVQGEKDKLLESENQSNYSYKHKYLHVLVRDFARKHHISNLYLIESKQGEVFYNLNKNTALGTNLFDGPYKSTELAATFQAAISNSNKTATLSDYSFFVPNLNKATGYIAYPVNADGEKDIIAIAELDADFFQQYLFDDWMAFDLESIAFSLIGKDHLLRTNDIELIRNKDKFLRQLEQKGRRHQHLKNAASSESCALNLGYNLEYNLDEGNQLLGKNYLGKKSYIISQPINFEGLNWSLVAHADIKKGFEFLKKIKLNIGLVVLVLLVISLYLVNLVKKSMTNRLHALKNSISNAVKGEKSEIIDSPWKDELGITIDEFEKLSDRISHASTFAHNLSEGSYSTEFKRESENDEFANALNTLREKLKNNKTEAEQRDQQDKILAWTNEGIAKFNDLLRQSNDNIKQLSFLIIENLIEYLGANQGGVFLVEGEEGEEKKIMLAASFAYHRRKFHTKTIEIGEGLLGNCYLEKKPIQLKQIPDNYIEITSGLGKATPKALYIVPLMVDENVLGFIELASLNDIEEYKINFINRLADNIAATFSTVKLNSKTAELLEESKRRANEIAQQEEEMRQNMEEMQATQEELARIRDDDEKRSREQTHELQASNKMIQQLLNSFDGELLLKDSQGIIVLANEEAALRFNSTPDKLRGKSDSDLFTPERAIREHELDQIVLNDGFYSEETTELVGSENVTYFVVKKQFFLPNRQEQGILTIRNKRK